MPTYLYFLLWGVFFLVMMRFGCGAHIMGHGHGHRGNKPNDIPPIGDSSFSGSKEGKNEHRH